MSRSSTSSSESTLDGRADDGLVALASPQGFRIGLVVAVFLLVCVGTGLTDLSWPVEVRALGAEGAREARLRSEASFWDGSLARVTERELAKRSRVRGMVGSPFRALQWGLSRDPGDDLLAGSDGYLYREGIGVLASKSLRSVASALLSGRTPGEGEASALRIPTRAVAFLNRRLGALGVGFHVLPVPAKILHRNAIGAEREDLGVGLVALMLRGCTGYGAAVLKELDVSMIEIERAFEEASRRGTQVFARTDTHWSFEGARVAARKALESIGFLVPAEERTTELVDRGPFIDAGNLYDVMGIDSVAVRGGEIESGILSALGALDSVPEIDVVLKASGDPGPRNGPVDAPVTLVGTSFSAAANFLPFLQHYSGGRVHGVALPAGGAAGALEFALRRAVTQGIGSLPEVVLWEFPEHIAVTDPRSFLRVLSLGTWLPGFGHAPVPGIPTPRGALRIGEATLGESPVGSNVDCSGLRYPPDGRVSLALRGAVDRPVEVDVLVPGRATVTQTWLPGRDGVIVPLIWGEMAQARVRVRGAGARLRLDALEVVWDLAMERARPVPLRSTRIAAHPTSAFGFMTQGLGGEGGLARGDSLLVDVPAGLASLRMEATASSNPEVEAMTSVEAEYAWDLPADQGRVVVALPSWLSDSELRFTGSGNAEAAAGIRVRVVPQNRLR